MYLRSSIIIPFLILMLSISAHGQRSVNTYKYKYTLITTNYGIYSDDTTKAVGSHQKTIAAITLFLNNYSNDTLKYWGTNSTYTKIFTIINNNDFRILNIENKEPGLIRMNIPPHRSQKIKVPITMLRAPNGLTKLTFGMKLLQWENDDSPPNKKKYPIDIQSDAFPLRYGKSGIYFTMTAIFLPNKKLRQVLPQAGFYVLTDKDQALYKLTAAADNIVKPVDTLMYSMDGFGKFKYFTVHIKLTNNDSDTLRFFIIDCSSYESFITNNDKIQIGIWPCFKNEPTCIKIPPHQSYDQIVPIIFKGNKIRQGKKFKIGFALVKNVQQHIDLFSFDLSEHMNSYIWSNEITIP